MEHLAMDHGMIHITKVLAFAHSIFPGSGNLAMAKVKIVEGKQTYYTIQFMGHYHEYVAYLSNWLDDLDLREMWTYARRNDLDNLMLDQEARHGRWLAECIGHQDLYNQFDAILEGIRIHQAHADKRRYRSMTIHDRNKPRIRY